MAAEEGAEALAGVEAGQMALEDHAVEMSQLANNLALVYLLECSPEDEPSFLSDLVAAEGRAKKLNQNWRV